MLDCLHRFDVQPGETYLIKGGVAHAIGAGCLLVEIQEPTDYTIRTERITPAGLTIAESMLHQGLGFEKMFDVFDYGGISKEEAYRSWCIPSATLEENEQYVRREVIGYRNTSCFCMERFEIYSSCTIPQSDRFSGLYILSGNGRLKADDGCHHIAAGDQYFIPATSREFTIEAGSKPITMFRCFGPVL